MRKLYKTALVLCFYFFSIPTTLQAAWFYTESGDVHSHDRIRMGDNTTASSEYSDYISGMCTNKGQSGIVTYDYNVGNDVSGGSQTAAVATGDGQNWVDDNVVNTELARYDYDYFLGRLQTTVLTTSTNLCDHGVGNVTSGMYRITSSTVSFNCTTGANKFSTGNKAYVFLVPGNVTITDEIEVDPGGFFMVVATGSIRFNSALGGNEDNPSVEGIFIANTINSTSTANSSTPLFAEGIFIAHQTLNLQRNSSDASKPSEWFSYNPSLLFNAPAGFRITQTSFEEVEP